MRSLAHSLIALTILICTACAGNKTIHVTETQIQNKLNERLSVPFSLLKIFDVNLSNALVTFDQSTGRMHTTFDTHLSSQLLEESQTGRLGISGKLRFDQAAQAVVLDEAEIESFELTGVEAKQAEVLNALAKKVGNQLLNGLPLYTVKPDELKVGTTHYRPQSFLVTDKGLQITLTPQH